MLEEAPLLLSGPLPPMACFAPVPKEHAAAASSHAPTPQCPRRIPRRIHACAPFAVGGDLVGGVCRCVQVCVRARVCSIIVAGAPAPSAYGCHRTPQNYQRPPGAEQTCARGRCPPRTVRGRCRQAMPSDVASLGGAAWPHESTFDDRTARLAMEFLEARAHARVRAPTPAALRRSPLARRHARPPPAVLTGGAAAVRLLCTCCASAVHVLWGSAMGGGVCRACQPPPHYATQRHARGVGRTPPHMPRPATTLANTGHA